MPSIRKRVDSDLLFFEFRFNGTRCREQTLLTDTPANRKKLEKVLAKIESEIADGTFVYANYFRNSKALIMGTQVSDSTKAPSRAKATVCAMGLNIFPSMPASVKMGR